MQVTANTQTSIPRLTSDEIRKIGEQYLSDHPQSKSSWWNCGNFFSRHQHHHLAKELASFNPAMENSFANWEKLISVYSRLNKSHGDLASAIAKLFNRDFPGKMPLTFANVPAPVFIEYKPEAVALEMNAVIKSNQYQPPKFSK